MLLCEIINYLKKLDFKFLYIFIIHFYLEIFDV
jgi:hypothetical protein